MTTSNKKKKTPNYTLGKWILLLFRFRLSCILFKHSYDFGRFCASEPAQTISLFTVLRFKYRENVYTEQENRKKSREMKKK